MANKKYNEFSAGTYDKSKIFLQADASTGALEKINLPQVGLFDILITKLNYVPGGSSTATIIASPISITASVTEFSVGSGILTYSSNIFSAYTAATCFAQTSGNNFYIPVVTAPSISTQSFKLFQSTDGAVPSFNLTIMFLHLLLK